MGVLYGHPWKKIPLLRFLPIVLSAGDFFVTPNDPTRAERKQTPCGMMFFHLPLCLYDNFGFVWDVSCDAAGISGLGCTHPQKYCAITCRHSWVCKRTPVRCFSRPGGLFQATAGKCYAETSWPGPTLMVKTWKNWGCYFAWGL